MSAPFPESKRATARRLRREEGLPVRAIAERLGIAPSTAGVYVRGLEAVRVCAYRKCGRVFESEHASRKYCCDVHRFRADSERQYARMKEDPAKYERKRERDREWRRKHEMTREERDRVNARRRQLHREKAIAAWSL